MTTVEKKFYDAFKKVIPQNYILQPQINLASLIEKKNLGNYSRNYHNELFRNIDFGIFDENYTPRLLIEINDRTHYRTDRKERDNKVRAICAQAGIPLITFWAKDGINPDYIRRRIERELHLTAEPPRPADNIQKQ